jgi:predicted phage terminase large subunit-like protein
MDRRRIDRLIAGVKDISPSTLKKAGITITDIQNLLINLNRLPAEEKIEVFLKLEVLVNADRREKARVKFLPFVRAVWPGFIEGAHLRKLATIFEDLAEKRSNRVIVNLPPRHGKSEFTSYLFPAWFIGRFPDRKIMIATHTATLAQGFGRKIRNLIETEEYQSIFPGTALAEDSKAQSIWRTSAGGEFFAAGVGSAIAGRGADCLIIDDPHSEQDARTGEYDPEIWEKTWQWYMQGPRQRLQPGAVIGVVHTRWNKNDMTDRLLREDVDPSRKRRWHLIRFPAILPSGNILWPEYWSREEIYNLRDELEPAYWEAQYQQNPTSEVVAIVKRSQWQLWDREIPSVEYIVSCFDTAHTVDKNADFSAWTTWGVFKHEIDGVEKNCVIMLEARRDRLEYPELKKAILAHHREFRPDMLRIEAKAAGTPLVQELRRMRLPVTEFTPTSATGNKIRRLRQVTDLFAEGRVFYPDRQWARDVIEEIAEFPRGQHDDFVDTVSMALDFLRQENFVREEILEEDEEEVDLPDQEYY